MTKDRVERFLPDEDATGRLGQDLAAALKRGDVLALHGDLGAGKTTLARAVIRALAGDPDLDVPSPTFTLVQPYAGRIPVHHFDLYRLSSPDELAELGLEEALDDGVAIVEWPERAGLPATAIHVKLFEDGEGRRAELSASADAMARLSRTLAIRDFLDQSGFERACRGHLTGDASARAYETIETQGGRRTLLMNAPRQPDGPPIRDGKPYSQIAHLAESVVPFVALDRTLRHERFAAPEIHAADLDAGLLLIEDLGRHGVLDADGRPIRVRYEAAGRLLASLHGKDWPRRMEAAPGIDHQIPVYDRQAMAIETELVVDWYWPYAKGAPADGSDREAFRTVWHRLFDRLERAETSLVLRDYHSPNLIWRDGHAGNDRIGLIDFQDALIGPSAYDVASLALDARVTIAPELEAAVVEAYCAARAADGAFDRQAFEEAYAIMAAQRNSKILGIFVRLNERDGKPAYLKHLPRIRDYLARALAHPALGELRSLYERAGILP